MPLDQKRDYPNGFRPIWRILAVLVTLCGLFVAFGEFFYQLGRHSR